MAKKKKPAANPARGFATQSLPSKAKTTEPPKPVPEEPVTPPKDDATGAKDAKPTDFVVPTPEEEAEAELQKVVDVHGPKVRRESQRIVNRSETEKRTLRNTCYVLKVGRILAFDHTTPARHVVDEGEDELLGEKILRLARDEYKQQLEKARRANGDSEGTLVQSWTLHRALLALGFPEARVEECLKEIATLSGNEEKSTDVLLDDLLEWMAIHCDIAELPKFAEPVAPSSNMTKKSSSEIPTPADSGRSTPAIQVVQTADTRHKSKASVSCPTTPKLAPSTLAAVTHSRLLSEISNLELTDKQLSDKESAADELAHESEEDDDDEELEDTPENLIPRYVNMRTRLYHIHPSLSPAVSIKKGKSRSTAKIEALPAGLTAGKIKKVRKIQDQLVTLERDPLFDLRTADAVWMGERINLEELNSEKRSRSKSKHPARNSSAVPKRAETSRPSNDGRSVNAAVQQGPESAPQVPEDDDAPLMGGLFEGPPTEEATVAGESIAIRDFEESTAPSTTFGGKGGKSKGRAGVGAAGVRKIVEEVCKSRDSSCKVRFEVIPGTSISNRCRLIISWSQIPSVLETPKGESSDVAIAIPNPTTTIFEMRSLAAATKEQAEGFIATYALFKIFGKKDEKLYLRLPTIWRNVWAEFVELDRLASDAQERKVLANLKNLLAAPDGIINGENGSGPSGERKESVASQSKDMPLQELSDKPQQSSDVTYWEAHAIMEDWHYRRNRPSYLMMEEYRKHLPMWAFRQEVLRAVEENDVVVLCGETGCGKSTQLPAFLLENELSNGRPCKIFCTEPRRISALSLAKRVSEELGERKGEVGGKNSLVGYAIRLESATHEGTRLVYATTGIVMRMLERQPDLQDVTHLILDEVHERSIESDFLLVVLRRLLVKRKDLKVVLMSATVDAERFSNYLGGAPILNVPGRTFPVSSYFLEDAIELTNFKVEDDPRKSRNRNQWDDNDAEIDVDGSNGNITSGNMQSYKAETKTALSRIDHYQIQYELIVRLLETIATSPEYVDFSQAILVFLPGLNEIRRLNDMILAHPLFGFHAQKGGARSGGWLVYPLHSTIASEDQEQAFNIPPPGMRKIVLATNIAETGITIPDVTAVIDTGKHKEMRFDEKRQLSRLVETFIARANAKQRRGRAGRVQEGICFHMFTKGRYETAMADQQTPEIMRLSLQDLVLRVKICGLGNVEEVLTSALDSPLPKNIRRAVDSLVEVKALTAQEELTPLGRRLAKLPLDVYLGKLVLLGCIYGCLDATVTIAAILSSKNPFVAPMGYRAEADKARLSFKRGDSDLLTQWNAYSSWRRVCAGKGNISEAEFCRKNYLSGRTLSNIEDLKGQLIAAVIDAGFLTLDPEQRAALNRSRYTTYRRSNFFIPPDYVNRNSENDSVVNAVVAAGFYPKLLVRDGKGWRNISNGKSIQVHMASVNKFTDSSWLAYYGIMQANNKFYDAHETSHVDEIAIALLCGDVEFKMYSGVAIIDGNRIKFSFSDWKGMVAVKMLRAKLRDIITRSFRNPGRELSLNHKEWLEIFFRVFEKIRAIQQAQRNKT